MPPPLWVLTCHTAVTIMAMVNTSTTATNTYKGNVVLVCGCSAWVGGVVTAPNAVVLNEPISKSFHNFFNFLVR